MQINLLRPSWTNKFSLAKISILKYKGIIEKFSYECCVNESVNDIYIYRNLVTYPGLHLKNGRKTESHQ